MNVGPVCPQCLWHQVSWPSACWGTLWPKLMEKTCLSVNWPKCSQKKIILSPFHVLRTQETRLFPFKEEIIFICPSVELVTEHPVIEWTMSPAERRIWFVVQTLVCICHLHMHSRVHVLSVLIYTIYIVYLLSVYVHTHTCTLSISSFPLIVYFLLGAQIDYLYIWLMYLSR